MKKIKKLFGAHNNEQIEEIKQNQITDKCAKNDLAEKCQTENLEMHENQAQCLHCIKNVNLINKYEFLIKLLKIKIVKLEKKHVQQQNQQNQVDKIQDFEDFIMELDTSSLQTLKNATQRNLSPFKALKFNSNLQQVQNEKSFDKTVLKFEKTVQTKSAKHLKNILHDLKMLNQDPQIDRYHKFKTSKSIDKRSSKIFSYEKLNKEFGGQISFMKLMKKSQFSINTSKNILQKSNIIGSSYSSIKGKQSTEKQNSQSLKAYQLLNNKVKQESQTEKKIKSCIDRIEFLTETIIDLKSFLMHVRHSIFQFAKMTDIEHLKNHENLSYEMLKIIMRIFEFSQDEMREMIGKSKRDRQSKLHNFFFSTLAR